MGIQEPIDDVGVEPPRTLHVRVVTDSSVQVRGASPQWMINLLQTGGDVVVVEGGDAPSTRVASVVSELSERELEVLTRIASGQPNHQIAEQMYLSINTVKSYIRTTYRKLGVASRTEAVIWAIDQGVVPAHSTE